MFDINDDTIEALIEDLVKSKSDEEVADILDFADNPNTFVELIEAILNRHGADSVLPSNTNVKAGMIIAIGENPDLRTVHLERLEAHENWSVWFDTWSPTWEA